MLIYFPAKNYPEPVAAREFLKSCVITACLKLGLKPDISNDKHVKRGIKVNIKPDADFWRLPSGRLKKGAKVEYAARSWKGRMMTNHACWHGHRDFMFGFFELAPNAVIRTKLAHYKGHEDYICKYQATYHTQVGSMMQPSTYGDNCDC